MPDEMPAPTPPAVAPQNSADNKEHPTSERANYVFIAVGLLITFAGFLTEGSGAASARMMLVIGLGLLCGAMGATANIKFKAWSMSGGAAIGLILGWFLSSEVDNSVGRIVLLDPSGDLEVRMTSDNDFYSAKHAKSYKFLVIPERLDGISHFQTEITDASSMKDEIFPCISTSLIKIGGEKPLALRFVPVNEAGEGPYLLNQEDNQSVDNPEACKPGASSPTVRSSAAGSSIWRLLKFSTSNVNEFFSTAWAGQQKDVNSLIRSLQSDSSFIRRNARKDLASAGPTAIPAMMSAFEQDGPRYRTRLGVLVATSQMLKENPKRGPEIANQISTPQLTKIVSLAGDQDRTISNYALQVLYGIRAPETADATSTVLSQTQPARRENLLVLLRDSLEFASADTKRTVTRRFRRASRPSPQTTENSIIKQIDNVLKDGAYEKEYSVVAGAYSKPEYAQKAAKSINSRGIKAYVTKPDQSDRLTRVIIGKPSTRAEAEKTRRSAIDAGIADKSLWLSDRPYAM